ncbi:MAG: MBL fold metallo-hydrolase [Chloroflexi bacterium]|nr:MAG: MBL fold metallo-hydrolase [Chloroflexota bacterium]
MEIVWLGHACFRIRGREATVLTDPCPPSSGYNIGKPTADIVTLSHDHDAHSYTRAVSGHPVILNASGEYEIHGAFITGISTHHDDKKGEELGSNVAFIVEMEDIRICHLGDLGHTPSAEQAEDMTGVDILFVPVGGGSTIDGVRAAEVVSLLEARLVIPMHYKTEALKDNLEPADKFLKEMGVSAVEPLPKLTVSRGSLPADTQVMLLDYRR